MCLHKKTLLFSLSDYRSVRIPQHCFLFVRCHIRYLLRICITFIGHKVKSTKITVVFKYWERPDGDFMIWIFLTLQSELIGGSPVDVSPQTHSA